jgi:hypothetical protein
MSLEIYAKHLADQGRGPDDTLVHMSRKEVKSLNDLAMAHGGHLTINPKTGLPEAGFLSALLPMAAGAALTGLSGGALSPLAASMIVGAGSYAMNPNKGLMGALSAGMGAYGGANLGQSLAMEGLQATAPTAAQVTPESIKPFTTDLNAYKGLETSMGGPEAWSGMGQNPATSLPAGGASNISYGMTSTPGQPISYSGGNAFYNTTLPTDAPGSFTPSTITQPAASPNITPDSLKDLSISQRFDAMKSGLTSGNLTNLAKDNWRSVASAATPLISEAMKPKPPDPVAVDKDLGQRYSYSAGVAQPLPSPDVPSYDQMLTQQGNFGRQQNYYPSQGYTPISSSAAKDLYHFANGGPVETMSNQAAMGANTMYPMANMATSSFATPYQNPVSTNMLAPTTDSGVTMNGEPSMQGTRMATGGISDAHYNLGGYSDGGRLLRGPGDGVSDSIPAMIGKKQPARLADGEFVVPARIVSEIGNGSTEAGARKLYAMMDRVQAARRQTVGKGKVAKNSRADKYLPA